MSWLFHSKVSLTRPQESEGEEFFFQFTRRKPPMHYHTTTSHLECFLVKESVGLSAGQSALRETHDWESLHSKEVL